MNDPLGRAFLIMLCKGNVHKDRADLDKQVCFLRHKRHLLCSVFSTAASAMFKLTNHPTVNFCHPGDTRLTRASWWDIPPNDSDEHSGECAKQCFALFSLGSASAEASNSTKETCKACGIKTSKVTHHRTTALQLAGFEGLHPHQINTMTKHNKLDKQHASCQSEAEREVRHACFSVSSYVTNATSHSHCS
jgi:hypothetical protein